MWDSTNQKRLDSRDEVTLRQRINIERVETNTIHNQQKNVPVRQCEGGERWRKSENTQGSTITNDKQNCAQHIECFVYPITIIIMMIQRWQEK